jgi:hypothetical protein
MMQLRVEDNRVKADFRLNSKALKAGKGRVL